MTAKTNQQIQRRNPLRWVRYIPYGILLLVVACTFPDPYFDSFAQVAIGDSRTKAIDLLGTPTSVNSIEMPLLRLEHLMWRSKLNDRVYVLFVAMDRVAGKTILQ